MNSIGYNQWDGSDEGGKKRAEPPNPDKNMKKVISSYLVISIIIFLQGYAAGVSRTLDFNIGGCYIGAFVSWKTVDDDHPWKPTAVDIKEFEKMIGRKLAIVTSYQAFSYNEEPYYFPFDVYETIKKNGSILFLTWEPRDWNATHPLYYEKSMLPDIIAGKYDGYIDRWARDVKKLDRPIFLRFAQEMNIENFSWSGARNGGGKKDGFGDPNIADGPEVYIAAYRHVHDRFKAAGVNNVFWVWTPINWGLPFEPWNHYTNYYPGDDYVDIVAMDEYNWGASQSWSQWKSFNEMYWQLYSELINLYPAKTLIIGEFSSSEKGGDKAKWIKDAFKTIKEKYPKIKAFVWHHVDNRQEVINNLLENCDWRINSSSDCVNAAREALSDNYYLEKVASSPDGHNN